MIFRTLPEDVYTLSIQIGESLEADKYNSVFMEMMEQVKMFVMSERPKVNI